MKKRHRDDVSVPSLQEVRESLERALSSLSEKDPYLLKIDVNERTITHKLAENLQQTFVEWDVDGEYNRDHDDPKMLKRLRCLPHSVPIDDTEGRTVFPDIIIHHRGHNGKNLLVIEAKKST